VKVDGADRLTFSGVAVYSPALFRNVPVGSAAKLAPLLREAILKDVVTGQHHHGIWHDVGTPQRLEELNRKLKASHV
ncbi:MAG: mannose-1-phosphate guanylyltransferase, partial [Nitrosomonadales bacterium]|nr:mannose-1-phosphate guanylyltransferase [Nitrosomonadales bacterium]